MTLLRLSTFDGCGLAIGAYPRFRYDASSGGGRCASTPPGCASRRLRVVAPGCWACPCRRGR
ncbi:MAG: hypothetical protein ACKO25_01070 [Cyanobium sp.]